MVTAILIIVGVLFNTTGHLLLKQGTNAIGHLTWSRQEILSIGWRIFSQPYIFAALISFVLGVAVWIVVLSRSPVSTAYAALALGYIFNLLAAHRWLGEQINKRKIAGMAFILVGVTLVLAS